MKDGIYLTAVIPPSHVSAKVLEYQHGVFRRYGIVTGLFLDPHIPLAFTRTPPEDLFSRDIPQEAPFVTTGLIRDADHTFLGVETGGQWERLASMLPASGMDGPYSPRPGIFLFTLAPDTPGVDTGSAASLTGLKWFSSTLRCMWIRYLTGEDGAVLGWISETVCSRAMRKVRLG